MQRLLIISFFVISLLIVVPSTSCAQSYSPFTAGSTYACAYLNNGKTGIGTLKNGSYRLSKNFDGTKSTIEANRTKEIKRRTALRGLLLDIKQEKENRGFFASLDKLTEELLNVGGGTLTTDQERIDAINQMITIVTGRIEIRGVELKALNNCKKNKRPTNFDATFKVALYPGDDSGVVVIAQIPAGVVDPKGTYCGTVPDQNPFTGIVFQRKIGGPFSSNPCFAAARSCPSVLDNGYLGMYVIGSFGVSSTQRDATIAAYEALFSGSAAFTKLKSGESCG